MRDVERDVGRFKNHVDPLMGSKRIGEIEARDLLLMIRDLRRQKKEDGTPRHADGSIVNMLGVCSSVFELAILEGRRVWNSLGVMTSIPSYPDEWIRSRSPDTIQAALPDNAHARNFKSSLSRQASTRIGTGSTMRLSRMTRSFVEDRRAST